MNVFLSFGLTVLGVAFLVFAYLDQNQILSIYGILLLMYASLIRIEDNTQL